MNPYVGYDNIIPLLAPVDVVNATTISGYMDLKGANRAAFLVVTGNIHSGSASDTYVITVEACTDPTGSPTAIAFNYRLSGAVGTNTWGAITAATTAGKSLGISDDGKLLWVEIDPDALAVSDYRYVKIRATATDDMSNFVFGVLGLTDPKYKMTTFVTSTACASS